MPASEIAAPDSYDVAILALFVRVSDRKGNVDVRGAGGAGGTALQNRKAVVTVGFGSPYLIERFPQAETGSRRSVSATSRKFPWRARYSGKFLCAAFAGDDSGVTLKAGFGMELAANPCWCSDGCGGREKIAAGVRRD